MLCRLFQHRAAHGLTAGKEDLIPLFLQQRGILFPSAGDDRRIIFGQRRLHDLRDHAAGCRRVRGRLDDYGVACCDGVHRRLQRQQQRVVPGAHDEHVAQRLRMHVALRRELRQRRVFSRVFGQPVHVPDLPVDLRQQHAGLAHVALHLGFAQVFAQRCGDLPLAVEDSLSQVIQRFRPVVRVQRGACREERALLFQDAFQFIFFHAVPPILPSKGRSICGS